MNPRLQVRLFDRAALARHINAVTPYRRRDRRLGEVQDSPLAWFAAGIVLAIALALVGMAVLA